MGPTDRASGDAQFMGAIAIFLAISIICVTGGYAAERLPPGLPPAAALLLRYDADHDGIVTRGEMEAGLKADFAAADTNGDGCLDAAETRAENQRRLARDGAQASPLVDWNLDGCVDFREFANTVHSYFDLVDKKKDGRVTLMELRGPSMPIPPRPTPGKQTDSPAPPPPDSSQPANSATRPPGY
jgi:hypothetical protein